MGVTIVIAALIAVGLLCVIGAEWLDVRLYRRREGLSGKPRPEKQLTDDLQVFGARLTGAFLIVVAAVIAIVSHAIAVRGGGPPP